MAALTAQKLIEISARLSHHRGGIAQREIAFLHFVVGRADQHGHGCFVTVTGSSDRERNNHQDDDDGPRETLWHDDAPVRTQLFRRVALLGYASRLPAENPLIIRHLHCDLAGLTDIGAFTYSKRRS